MRLKRIVDGVRGRTEKYFPERQFFLRSRGRVRFLTLSGRQQLFLLLLPTMAAAGLMAGVVWKIAGQQSNIDLRNQKLALLEAENDRLVRERADLLAELTQSETRYSVATSELAQNQRMLVSLLQTQSELKTHVSKLKTQLAHIDEERARQQTVQSTLHGRFAQLREQLTRATYLKDEPTGSLQQVPAEPTLSQGSTFAALPNAKTGDSNPEFELAFDATKRLLELTAAERDEARAQVQRQKQALEARMAHLESRLIGLQDMQDRLIARIEIGTDRHITELEKVIELTGLKVDRLLGRVEEPPEGVGGPLVGIAQPAKILSAMPSPRTHPEILGSLEDRFDIALNRMGARLARWSALSAVTERLPLAAPINEYKVNSRFGSRRDPFTKRWAQHEGIDLTSKRRAEILTAAPGVITFAGWKGPYGRMVEVDHGFGLKTRYAHLYRISVKLGEKVSKRQRIGVIGSSGRSTGRHLHYEVHFDDRTLDPLMFLKAGNHVLENGQK